MKFIQEQKPPEYNVRAKHRTEDVELNKEQIEVVAGGFIGSEDGNYTPTFLL